MSDTGNTILQTILGDGTDAWGRLVFSPLTYRRHSDQELRIDVNAVQQTVVAQYPKMTGATYAAAFAKMASSEASYRAFAATTLHKRHQLNRRTKVEAGINQAAGLLADNGPVMKTTEGMPHA